ncbi:hypothetical protein SK128_023555 [Halocaridina rubra]|uniref:Ketimine reductase mu-crystallin n=1 Tax=Halocaridina rubra TaxID=373956 RepID=A0AAN8WPG5_HALRR
MLPNILKKNVAIFITYQIRIWNRNIEAAEKLVTLLISENIKAEVSKSVQEAARDADIINTCTGASTPILKADWVKAGAHINSVGAPRPDFHEIEEDLVRKGIIYTDSRESAENEAGDVIKAGVPVFAEIGEVLLGSKPANKNSLTIYKSLGLAVQDAVTARLVYNMLYENNPL